MLGFKRKELRYGGPDPWAGLQYSLRVPLLPKSAIHMLGFYEVMGLWQRPYFEVTLRAALCCELQIEVAGREIVRLIEYGWTDWLRPVGWLFRKMESAEEEGLAALPPEYCDRLDYYE